MKILMINETFSAAGGAEQYLFDVCRGLTGLGHEVAVVYGTETQISNVKAQNQNEKLKTYFVRGLEVDGVLKVVRDFNPEVINLQNVFDPELYLEMVKLKPTVRFIHDHRTYCPGSSKYWFNSGTICPRPVNWGCTYYAYKEKCLSRRPAKILSSIINCYRLLVGLTKLNRVICNSSFVRDQLLANGLPPEKVTVNPLFPGGQLESYHRNNTEESAIPEILFVGRLFIEKGVDGLLKAAALIKVPYNLIIAGEGWELENLKTLTRTLGLESKVQFKGFIPREEIEAYYDRCRMLVMPAAWPEPFGMVGLEALSHGKPVVAFKTGGISEWLADEKVGFLVRRGDIKELAGKIETLLTNPDLAGQMGSAGRYMVETEYRLESHLDRLLEVYREIARKN